ncbi:Modification methylase TaqI [Proteus mirabilis]|uniref:Eco57I restriction-modification methylase domain-containing protein n=2 Tax=Morganellaceae TaxID=1903414 RepID=UPI000E079453|nr:N-6 DNA methylase [Proteus mirabilis]SUC19804.1 Modification methylase TaqI [Proteus mirabilis]
MKLNLELDESLGQVWTPDEIAYEMVRDAFSLIPNAKKILDPSCGPATFSKAISKLNHQEIELTCYDVDPRMQSITKEINHNLNINSKTYNQDYLLDFSLENNFDLVIMNPPYIRQEKIKSEVKAKYNEYLNSKFGVIIDKKSNLFALFLLKGILDLAPGGILCAIVFDAVKNSGYGKKTLSLLRQHAELISSKSVKTPFENVIIDAQILFYRKREQKFLGIEKYENQAPSDSKLKALEQLLVTRRGTSLPKRAPFFAEQADPFFSFSSPFFIKQSRLNGLVIKPDHRIYLSTSVLEKNVDFQIWMKERLEKYNINERKKLIKPVIGKIVFNYYIRNAPRHLWNAHNIALSDNFYVSEPKNNFPPEAAWLLLNSEQYLNRLISASRNQGMGLLKLQLYEYKNVLLPNWNLLNNINIIEISNEANQLIQNNATYEVIKNTATNLVKKLMDI